MNQSMFEPKKSGNMVVRPLLPREKDDYTVAWWKSLSLSYITLPAAGAGLIVLSKLFGRLFDELFEFANTFYLYVSQETMDSIRTGASVGVKIGLVMVALGVFNLIIKIFRPGTDEDDDD